LPSPESVPRSEDEVADDQILEAAAALAEMAGGSRIRNTPSPSREGHMSNRSLFREIAEGETAMRPSSHKPTCCTPSKRPASISLWDGMHSFGADSFCSRWLSFQILSLDIAHGNGTTVHTNRDGHEKRLQA
jgi:hypothetical protein